MKVLFFIRSFFGGGAEKALLELVKGLDKEKFDITVMVRNDEGTYREQFHSLEGVAVRRCFEQLKPGKNLFQKIRNNVILKLADWSAYRCPGLFYRLAIREKYDVEIAFMHNEAASIISSSTNRKSKKLLWVHTDLRKLDSWNTYFGTRNRQKRYFSGFDKIVCVSCVAAQALENLLGIKENVQVIYNPIDRERILSLAEGNFPLPEIQVPTVCAVGRLSEEKNFEMLIDVHTALLKKGINHRLCIVGGGPERQALEDRIKLLGVADSVILAGYQENPYPYIKASDITVCSSRYEGLHIASQESLVLGKPVVSCCAVVGEIFGGYGCGIITENNAAALETGLEMLLTDTELLQRCAAQASLRGQELGLERAVKTVEWLLLKDAERE